MSTPDVGVARALVPDLADAPATRHSQRASVLLRAAIADATGPTVSVGDLIDRLGERAYGLLLVLLALGNVIPGPPGIGALFGIPIAILAGFMVLGRRVPRLPRVIVERRIDRARALGVLDRLRPWFAWVEALSRPRLEFLTRGVFERIAGLVILALAVAITLPVPLTNWPPAIAVIVLALATLERDGVALLVGFGLTAAALAVIGFAISIYVTSIGLVTARLLGG